MDAEQLKWLAIIVAMILGAVFLPVVIWAMVTRPSWWRLRDTIYATLLQLGIFFAWCVFIYAARPGIFFGVASFIAPMYGCYFIHEKFEQ
jgi:hypothetical protein